MKIVDDAQIWLGPGLAQRHGAGQSWQHLGEAKAAVKTVGGLGQIAPRVLGLSHGVATATDRPFDVAQQHVDPARALDLGGGAPTPGFQHHMSGSEFDHTPEAAQSIAEDFGIGRQAPPTPISERGVIEAAHRLDHGEGRVFQRLVGGYGHHEGLLVLRSPPGLATVALATQVGVVDLHEARELARLFALGHGLHDLVFELPGGVEAHAKVPLQVQRGHVGSGQFRMEFGAWLRRVLCSPRTTARGDFRRRFRSENGVASADGARSTNECRGFMLSPINTDVACSNAGRARGASWRWLMSLLLAGMACVLQGCANPPAPSPTPNPHPQQTVKLKITVEKGSEVNRVEVQSLWVVSNLSCAPVIWPAGNTRVKQVEMQEQVKKVGDDYIVTIIMDRFLADKCHWTNSGPDISYFHDKHLLSGVGVNDDVLSGKLILRMTCLTNPFMSAATCGLRDKELFYKSEDKTAFNSTVELLK